MAGHGNAALGMKTNEMCALDPDVTSKIRKLRFNKEKKTNAIIIKVLTKEDMIVIEDELEDVTVEEIAEELPDCQPRYIVYSYAHKFEDGRVTYPLCFIYYCPQGCKPEQMMRYAGCRSIVEGSSDIRKVFELRDKENLTNDWLLDKLKLT